VKRAIKLGGGLVWICELHLLHKKEGLIHHFRSNTHTYTHIHTHINTYTHTYINTHANSTSRVMYQKSSGLKALMRIDRSTTKPRVGNCVCVCGGSVLCQGGRVYNKVYVVGVFNMSYIVV
jgi:hypothetical protein